MSESEPLEEKSQRRPLKTDRSRFPFLASLIGTYFHQDYDLFGSTFEEIVQTYRSTSTAEEHSGTVDDIRRFIERFGATDASLAEAFYEVLGAEVTVESWTGLSVREWLLKVAEMLS